MGRQHVQIAQPVTNINNPPANGELEITLFGPGYGESVVLHVGGGQWVVVDSYLDVDGEPAALAYLRSLGIDPSAAVVAVVGTHWHDDHIGGLSKILATCPQAQFCCASVLCQEEFLARIATIERQHFSAVGSGVRELHGVFSLLRDEGRSPVHALANRRIFRLGKCEIWSLSPSDATFEAFLRSVAPPLPSKGGKKDRLRNIAPNDAAVALWVKAGQATVLLGSDLEGKGWTAVVASGSRPMGLASVFKVPHHGSGSGEEPEVWKRMLEEAAVAVLTPFRRGRIALPTPKDIERILEATPNAWITSRETGRAVSTRHAAIDRTLRETGAKFRRLGNSGVVRLRRPIGSYSRWKVGTFGNATHLSAYAS